MGVVVLVLAVNGFWTLRLLTSVHSKDDRVDPSHFVLLLERQGKEDHTIRDSVATASTRKEEETPATIETLVSPNTTSPEHRDRPMDVTGTETLQSAPLYDNHNNQTGSSFNAVTTTHPSTTTKNPNQTIVVTSWCFLDSVNTISFFHFPHALQALSQCWSFFQSQKERIKDMSREDNDNESQYSSVSYSHQCHVNMDKLSGLGSVEDDWKAALLVKVMQCTYSYRPYNLSYWTQGVLDANSFSPVSSPKNRHGGETIKFVPRNDTTNIHYLYRPYRKQVRQFRFFWQPQHAEELRNRLVQYLHKNQHQTDTGLLHNPNNDTPTSNDTNTMVANHNMDKPSLLRIGLVDRLSTRRIGNIAALQHAIQKAYPHAVVDRVSMEGWKPMQQFTWWSQQSIVILSHGAAAANLLFLPSIPSTAGVGGTSSGAVIELFPPHYYWWGFWKLAQSAQVRHYGYFPILYETNHTNGTQQQQQQRRAAERAMDLFYDYRKSCHDPDQRKTQRALSVLEPSIPHLLALLKRAIQEGHQIQRRQQRQEHKGNWSVGGNVSLYHPQIAHMESSCVLAQRINPHGTIVTNL